MSDQVNPAQEEVIDMVEEPGSNTWTTSPTASPVSDIDAKVPLFGGGGFGGGGGFRPSNPNSRGGLGGRIPMSRSSGHSGGGRSPFYGYGGMTPQTPRGGCMGPLLAGIVLVLILLLCCCASQFTSCFSPSSMMNMGMTNTGTYY